MTALRRLACLLVLSPLLFLSPLVVNAQATSAVLTFHFDRPTLPVPTYTINVHPDGTGTYTAMYAVARPESGSRYGAGASVALPAPAAEVTRPVTLPPTLIAHLFEHARAASFFRLTCEANAHNIANTGAKTLTYKGPDGAGECTYNYTENKHVEALATSFQALSYTLDEGRTLDLLQRYDRLGLDQAMKGLLDALHDGRAQEPSVIAPVLKSLVDDSQVMDRVRKRAQTLLDQIPFHNK